MILSLFNKLFFKNYRIQYIDENIIYSTRGRSIYCSNNNGMTWFFLTKVPVNYLYRISLVFEVSARLFRSDVSHLVAVGNNIIVIFCSGRIYNYDLETKAFSDNPSKISGSRPLKMCIDINGTLYYGKYHNNVKREISPIYKSNDAGRNWEVVFNMSGVRHVHGVFYDKYENKIWVTTGDSDKESGIWVTADKFQSLKKIIGGNQASRAVSLIFTQDYIYYGSDTPLQKNYIYRLERGTNIITKMQEVGSSVFWGCKVGDSLIFSTAVEPSEINKTRRTEVWLSADGILWRKKLTFCKDFYSMKYFQYGQVLFPYGENKSEYLWYTPFGTKTRSKSFIYNMNK
jgi:hypothetical protein